MYFLPHSNQYNFLEDERIYSILRNWVSFMPMVKSCLEIRQLNGSDYSWGLIVPVSFAEKHKIPVNEVVKRLPKRKTLFCDFCQNTYDPHNEKEFTRHYPVDKRLEKLGLTSTGTIYKVILMYNHINNSESVQENGYFVVPIE